LLLRLAAVVSPNFLCYLVLSQWPDQPTLPGSPSNPPTFWIRPVTQCWSASPTEIFSLSFVGLVVSGFAIILAHPRFYWGETGGLGTPSLFDLPLPFMLGGPSGWGRSLHFQSAWFAVLSGLLYAISGLRTQHFRRNLLPSRADLSWSSLRASIVDHPRFERPTDHSSYNVLQRLSYLSVIFLFIPLMIITGFAMSPAITSVFPQFVTVFGGQQTARTLHFFIANFLVLFLFVHIAMVILAGFTARMRAMITGRHPGAKEPS
jgi:thiosulfate reductase cytochrome b subunit